MTCVVERRNAAQRVAAAALDVDGVVDADALAPSAGCREGWTVEIVCAEPMPVALHQLLARNDLGVARAAPRGDHLHVVAT